MRTLFIGLVFVRFSIKQIRNIALKAEKIANKHEKYTHTSEHMEHSRLIKSCRRVVVSLFEMWMNWPPSQFTWLNRIHIERCIFLLFFCSNYKWHLQHLNALHHFWCQIVNISLCWIETIQQRRRWFIPFVFLFCFVFHYVQYALCTHLELNSSRDFLIKNYVWIWNGLFEGGYESNNFSFAEKIQKKTKKMPRIFISNVSNMLQFN